MHLVGPLNTNRFLPDQSIHVPKKLLLANAIQKKEYLSEELLRRLSNLPDSPHSKAVSHQPGFQTEGRKLINWLVGLLPEATRINKLGSPEIAGPKLVNGLLNPWGSINCLGDEVRTKRFFLAVREAIHDLDKIKSERIEVLDSGCGAFPLFAILTCLCSPKVHVTALEMNIGSVKIARDFVRIFGLEDRIKIVHADATKYIPAAKMDLLISETMDKALTNEPIAQILPLLSRHRSSEGICIPEMINIKLGIYWKTDPKTKPEHEWKYLGADLDMRTPIAPLLEIDQFSWKTKDELPEISLKGAIADPIKNQKEVGDPYLAAWAEVNLYKGITLNLGESVISSLAILRKCPEGQEMASVSYKPGTAKEAVKPIFFN